MRKVLLFLLLTSSFSFAQLNYATLNGTITDPQGGAFVGATVQLTAADTYAERRVTTNQSGIFQLNALLPGDYQLTVEAPGFATLTETIRLEVGQQATLDITLKVASVKNEVAVTDVAPVLHSNDAAVGEVIEPKSVKELPLNGRMLVDLVLTVPGAHESHGAQTGNMNPLYWRPGQRSAVSVSGSRPNGNYFLLDGTTNTDPTFNTQNLSPSPDAVKEFQVQTGSYSAEMGGAGGGQINIVSRSGANEFHGTAYEFIRNGVLDASTFDSMGNKHMVQNNFGASFGGPIQKNKTFFFLNYEGFRHAMATTMFDTVPTEAEVNGDFSQSDVNIFDPLSAPAGSPRTQFQDNGVLNVIPQDRINPVAQQFLMNYVPMPNADMMGMDMDMMPCGAGMMGAPSTVGAGVDCNNYIDTRTEYYNNNQATTRIDHLFDNGDSLVGRYSLSSEYGYTPGEAIAGLGSLLPGFGAYNDNFSQQGAITWNRIINTNKVNTATLTVSRLAMHRYTEDGTNDVVGALGIQGLGSGGSKNFGAPFVNIQGFSPMGDNYQATPVQMWDTIFEGRDVLAWQHGKHSLKFGGSYRRYIWPMWAFVQGRGYYQATSGFTTQTGKNDGTGSALASFLLGLPAVKQRQFGEPKMMLRQWTTDGFVQDKFQLTRNTTIEMGLRYEYADPLWDTRYANSNLNMVDGKPEAFVGGQNGFPKGLTYGNKHNFAPRFGFSQAVPRFGLVVHSAFGIFYTPVDLNTWCNMRHNVPFVFPETQQSDNFNPAVGLVGPGPNQGFNFAPAVLGQTTVSYTAIDPHAPQQYIEQWSLSVEKSLGKDTTLELGYLGARGVHLQRADLINNAPPGPGAIGPRRPFVRINFAPNTTLPANVTYVAPAAGCATGQMCFPVSTINLLQNTAQSWYDAGYVNLRRRYSHGLTLLTNYTWSKSLSNAPDFRSPMFESAIPQNDHDLNAEKGPACDVRHRFVISAVYDIPGLRQSGLLNKITRDWGLSTLYQIQTGFPFTISVFGDTANAGTVLNENPIRANYTGQQIFPEGSKTANGWFNPAAFAAPAAFTFGDTGRNAVYGPGMQTLDFAVVRNFSLTERMKFQFRTEFFNALNHTNLGTPNRFVNTPQFGTITESTTPGREIQLSARLSF